MSDTPTASRLGHPHVRHALLAAAASISAIVFVVGVFGMSSYFFVRSKISTIPDASPSPGTTPGIIDAPCVNRSCNFLILGSDSRIGLTPEEIAAYGSDAHNGGVNRSDTIIVVHTNPDTGKAVILHFPRDLWVNIPGQGWGKINSAFEGGLMHGGPDLVARTIRRISGLQINHMLYVNLAGFQHVVDAIGGVPMCVDRPLYDQRAGLNIPKAGCYTFDGRTALAYVRARHLPGDCIPDFARIARQQQFLRAVLNKVLSPGQLWHLTSSIPAIAENLWVDKGLRDPIELRYLAQQLQGVSTGAADFRVVPTVPDEVYPGGIFTSIVRMVQPQANELFKAIRDGARLGQIGKEQEDTPPSPANIRVAVFDNGNGGAAKSVFDTLNESGFDVSPGLQPIAEFGHTVSNSVMLYRPADANMAEVAKGFIPNLTTKAAPKGWLTRFDLAIVVGPGFTPEQPGGSTGAPPPSC